MDSKITAVCSEVDTVSCLREEDPFLQALIFSEPALRGVQFNSDACQVSAVDKPRYQLAPPVEEESDWPVLNMAERTFIQSSSELLKLMDRLYPNIFNGLFPKWTCATYSTDVVYKNKIKSHIINRIKPHPVGTISLIYRNWPTGQLLCWSLSDTSVPLNKRQWALLGRFLKKKKIILY